MCKVENSVLATFAIALAEVDNLRAALFIGNICSSFDQLEALMHSAQ